MERKNAIKIYNKIRAFKYFPGTYFYHNGIRINLIDGIPITEKHNKKSGYVIDINQGIKIACGQNSIFQILTIQKEGKKIMPIRDFLNGSKIKIGDFLNKKNIENIRIALLIEYNGKNLVGWQKQNNGTSVQGELERCTKILFKKQCIVQGAGRTDAGVNALGQVAHVDIPAENRFFFK